MTSRATTREGGAGLTKQPADFRCFSFNPRARTKEALDEEINAPGGPSVGLAVYDPMSSKYGWHIIKRLE